jgi:alpha-tubulin suppressor-like RCC1 family protein
MQQILLATGYSIGTSLTPITSQPYNIKLISCGRHHIVFVTETNEIMVYGKHCYFGQLGLGQNCIDTEGKFVKVEVYGLQHKNIKLLNCGDNYTILVTDNNEVLAVGDNCFGQLGLNHNDNVYSFQRVILNCIGNIEEIACGSNHIIIRTDQHELFGSGMNHSGQLGINSTIDQWNFIRINGTEMKNSPEQTTIFGKNISQIACGDNHTVLLTEDHSIYATGSNHHGQIGISDVDMVQTFHKVMLGPTLKSKSIKHIACGDLFTIVLTECGRVLSCGSNSWGALGLGLIQYCNTFQQAIDIPQTTVVKDILNNGSVSESLFLLTEENEFLVCGNNKFGQLSLGDCNNRNMIQKMELSLEDGQHVYGILHNGLFTVFIIGTSQDTSCTSNVKLTIAPSDKHEREKQEIIQMYEQKLKQMNSAPPVNDVLKRWIIPDEDIVLGDQVRSDSNDNWYKAKWSGTPVLVNMINIDNGWKSRLASDLSNTTLVRHPSCSQFLGVFYHGNELGIVTETLDTTLYDALHTIDTPLSDYEKVRIMSEIAKGLLYIHTRQPSIAHLNLNSSNVLVNWNCTQLKLSGYNMTILVPHRTKNVYTAPEVVTGRVSLASDVYSFGVLCLEIWTRQIPSDDIEQCLSSSTNVPSSVQSLIQSCCAKDTSTRPKFKEIIAQIQTILDTVVPSKA